MEPTNKIYNKQDQLQSNQLWIKLKLNKHHNQKRKRNQKRATLEPPKSPTKTYKHKDIQIPAPTKNPSQNRIQKPYKQRNSKSN
jgi:hypothetical protein